jgi:hypothetical protein
MESLGYAGHTQGSRRACLGDPSRLQTGETMLAPLQRGEAQIIGEEIHKLLKAGFIKEVHHPEWLTNPVLVKKKNGK